MKNRTLYRVAGVIWIAGAALSLVLSFGPEANPPTWWRVAVDEIIVGLLALWIADVDPDLDP